jgi:transcriptional regulator with XRE-family HTH domain
MGKTRRMTASNDNDESVNAIVGARVRAARAARDMTQPELCAIARLTVSALSEVEGGKRALRVPGFFRVARGLEVSADYLLGRSDSLRRVRN